MVEKAAIELKSQSRQFDDVHFHALQFARMANANIMQRAEAILEVKRMFDEHAVDESNESEALEHYRTYTYNAVMDQVVQSLESRFKSHRQIYFDMACFNTSNFGDLVISGTKENCLHSVKL
jgi:hypothetical protein